MGDSFSRATPEIQTQFDLPDFAGCWCRLRPLFVRRMTEQACFWLVANLNLKTI
jgi:hypothetical protein